MATMSKTAADFKKSILGNAMSNVVGKFVALATAFFLVPFTLRRLGDADFGLHYIGLSGTDVTDEVTGLTLDGEFTLDRGACLDDE